MVEFDRDPGVSAPDVNARIKASLMPRSTHVSQAEVNIKVVKQRVRTEIASILYSPPKTVLIQIVIAATMISNTLARNILHGLSPQESFYGNKQSYSDQFAFCPSDYVEVHTQSDNIVSHFRTVSAIPLHPNPENLKEWTFYSLTSGKIFNEHSGNAYLMPWSKSIIDRVNTLAVQDPIIGDSELSIRTTDLNYVPQYIQPPLQRRGRPPGIRNQRNEANDAIHTMAEDFLNDYFHPIPPSNNADLIDIEWKTPDDADCIFTQITTELEYGDLIDVDADSVPGYFSSSKDFSLCFATHLHPKQAREIFGEAETESASSIELEGLLKLKAFEPVSFDGFDFSTKKVIPMSLFLRDKLDSMGNLIKLKARLVAGGHRQDRTLYPNRGSPTAAIQSIFSIINIAAAENRHVLTFDVSMAYLQADMNEELYMILDKDTTSLLLKLHPEFSHFARSGKLLVQLKKALYGCVQSAKLWYERISAFLFSIGFVINPVDQCVFNRISSIDGSQITIGLHVDDGLVTCTNKDEMNLLMSQIQSEFDITIHEGPIVEYLGIKIDFSNDEAKLLMPNYIKEILRDNSITTFATTPASNNLFDVDEASPLLSTKPKEKFHSTVASLLYLATRTRPDIMLPVTFLCSRVSIATEQDHKKLVRILSYLNATVDLPFVLGKRGTPIIVNCYADASFAVHKDYKSHGGIAISCGHGFVWCKCTKQKIVTKSSTEAELVTLSDAVSMTAWTIQFLKGQGYLVKPNLFQDNLSTIALANAGRSTSDRTRHINIRYFFVNQYLKDGVMSLHHCPATDMIADIFTKPLQGYEFTKLRDLILGISTPQYTVPSDS